MEREKCNLGYVFLVGFLCLVLGLLCGYIISDKVLSKMVDDSADDGSISTGVYNYSLSKRENVQIVNHNDEGNSFMLYVDLDGNAYMDVNGISDFESKYGTYSLKGYENYEGTNTLDAYKLDIENVLYAQNTYLGNGGFSYCIFILDGGEVAYLNYYEFEQTGNPSIKKIDGLKNIVSVVSGRVMPYVIDINGNEYMLSDYIK